MFKILGPGQIYMIDLKNEKDIFGEFDGITSGTKYFGISELTEDRRSVQQFPAFKIYSTIKINGSFSYDVEEYTINYSEAQSFLDGTQFESSIGHIESKRDFLDKIMQSDNRLIIIHSLSFIACSLLSILGLIFV